jgi:2,3-bisphosphoglycerate-dependent phosphoglycerate mutase
METTLYFIRHAQSHPSRNRHYSEWPLSLKGQKQARQLSNVLRLLGVEKIFSSPFLRCLKTIEPFARSRGIDVVVEDDLRERLVAKTLIDGFNDVWNESWKDFDYALPGCETSSQAQKRFVTAVSSILGRNGHRTIAISTHGNVMGLFLNFIDTSFGKKETEAFKNPHIIRIVFHRETFSWDRDYHIPELDGIATHHRETPVDG